MNDQKILELDVSEQATVTPATITILGKDANTTPESNVVDLLAAPLVRLAIKCGVAPVKEMKPPGIYVSYNHTVAYDYFEILEAIMENIQVNI